jgi:hypothetical protein
LKEFRIQNLSGLDKKSRDEEMQNSGSASDKNERKENKRLRAAQNAERGPNARTVALINIGPFVST